MADHYEVLGVARDASPDDIKRVAVPVLAHRLTLTPQAWAQGVDPQRIVETVMREVAVPPTVGAAA